MCVKTKRKHVGTKAQIIAMKEREKRIATTVFLAFILIIAAVSGYYTYTFLNQPRNPASPFKAAIVDHLSLTFPNQTFRETATNILKQAGYMVDYYPGEKVTVDFYRNLPACGYKIVILRVHCGIDPSRQSIAFFTSEVFRQSRYVDELLTDHLEWTAYDYPPPAGEPLYFGINSLFVKDSMKGRFSETTIIMMGCYGLEYPSMAKAFIQKGAKAYISWKGSVTADHTDKATINLLKHLILEKQAVGQAVENTMREVGEDPAYKSTLTYYLPEAGEQTAQDIMRNHKTG